MDTAKKYQRYQRQILLKEFGIQAQDKLLNAKVLVIGAGGLGCPALQYLAAAGVGQIGIVDFDVVTLSNLQRQILYHTEDIGNVKAETAAKKIRALNTGIAVDVINERIHNGNALDLISRYDIVLDGSDDFTTRYMVNDACVLLDIPLVYGAVLKFEGQVGVFNLADKETGLKSNYRDLFPVPPVGGISCNDVGVLGVLPGIIGTMQATEVIKILTGIGHPLCNRIATYNALENSLYAIEVSKNVNADTTFPITKEAFLNYDYELFCNGSTTDLEITGDELDVVGQNGKLWLIDVREQDELPLIDRHNCMKLPLSIFENNLDKLPVDCKMVFVCQSGSRSKVALRMLRKHKPGCEAYSLQGGVGALKGLLKMELK